MGNFSIDPLSHLNTSISKDYIGLRIEQGTPLLDRDLMLLGELSAATIRRILARYIGDGIAEGFDGFVVRPTSPASASVEIAKPDSGDGWCLVRGLEIRISSSVTIAAPAPPGSGERVDTVYLDIWISEVDDTVDNDLKNLDPGNVGMRTSVRLKPNWEVKIATDATSPPDAAAGHMHYALAHLTRQAGQNAVETSMIKDLRRKNLSLSAVESRLRALEDALLPSFTDPPFFPTSAAPETSQVIVLSGRNIIFGNPRVFIGDESIKVNKVTYADENNTQTIEAQLEPGELAPGDYYVTVKTDVGSVVSATTFTIKPYKPVFDANPFDPDSAAVGDVVTLNGSHFEGTTAVRFGTVDATEFSVTNNGTRIEVKVPDMGAVPVSVNIRVYKAGLSLPVQTATKITITA